MSELGVAVPGRSPMTEVGHPSWTVFAHVARAAARSAAMWGGVFAVFAVVQLNSYMSIYTTQASRDQLARAYGTNPGLNALLGAPRAMDTVAGWAQWRFVGILGPLGCIWAVLTATRLLRGEEDAGRYDLLVVGQTTPRRAVAQAVAGLAVGLTILLGFTVAGVAAADAISAAGIGAAGCVWLSIDIVAGPGVLLAFAALASQLADTRRRAAAATGVAYGVAFALRMVADTDPGLRWLAWLSPLGWIERYRPLTGPRPAAMAAVALLVFASVVGAWRLAGARDVGGAVIARPNTGPVRPASVGNPLRLAIRLTAPAAAAWVAGVAALASLMASTAASSTTDVTGSNGIARAIGRLGGHGSLYSDYLGLAFLMVALGISLMAAGQISAFRSEETDGTLENLLVAPFARARWLAMRLTLSALVVTVAGVLAAISTWAGASGPYRDTRFLSLLAAGVNIVPAALLILGLGTLAIGARPGQAVAVVYGYLAWAFLVEFAGSLIHTSHWLLDTSVFFHIAPAPATSPDWTSAAAITATAVGAAVAGVALFRRRDIEQA